MIGMATAGLILAFVLLCFVFLYIGFKVAQYRSPDGK
jgi:hypothetical protein